MWMWGRSSVQPVVIVLHQLGYGGATKAVFDQAKMFSRAGARTTIATFEDDPGFRDRVAELRETGVLPEDVVVRNLHDDAIRGASTDSGASDGGPRLRHLARRAASGAARLSAEEPEKLVESGRDRHGEYRRIFRGDGEVLAFERLGRDGSVQHTNYFENRVLIRRDEHVEGAVRRRVWFDPSGASNREQHLTADGFCYAQRWVNPQNGRGAGVFVADRDRGTVRRFDGIPSWHAHWLQSVVDGCGSVPFVIGQAPSVIPKILRLRRRSAVRMAMMHNSHLTAPFSVDSPLRPDYLTTFDQLEDLDAFVVLSERQRLDMVARLGGDEVLTVVPNVMDVPEPRSVPRDARLVSIVSRLAEQKALHEAIEAFALVVDRVPEARLEIYGQGKERRALEQLIAARSLGSHVHLMGRTRKPLDVMARSVCTVSTSEWEALPLSIAESLAVRTPVVAYDCLYGPSTLIQHGRTGHVVPRYDRGALAEAVVGLLTHPEQVERMGGAGRADVTDVLGPDAVMEAWNEAFSLAQERFERGAGREDERSSRMPIPASSSSV